MAVGPFVTYVPPGVYTRTLTEANVANLVAGLRIPVIIGVGQQELTQNNIEMVRGSAGDYDQPVIAEDVSLSWVVDATNPNHLILGAQTGAYTTFRVRNYPIADGQGLGRVTNDTRAVSVTVNGTPVSIGGVNGQLGLVTLQVPTTPTDQVRCTYYMHRKDTAFSDDLSDQVTGEQAILTTPGIEPFLITAGSNDQFSVKVNGTIYSTTLAAGSITAASLKAMLDGMAIANFTTSVYTDGQGNKHVKLISTQEVEIQDGSANGVLGFSNYAKTNNNKVFQVWNRPIVDGTDSGRTTTDTSKVVVKVNGTQVIPSAVDGANGLITLAMPPAMGSTVTVDYYSNTWQDTFDQLPNTLVTTVIRCGIATNRSDYIQGQDFVVQNPSVDVSVIHWGTSWAVTAGTTSTGATPWNDVQVTGALVDEKFYLAECTRLINTTTIPATISTNQFLLPEVPTTGNGRDTTLGTTLFSSVTNGKQDLITNRPDLVVVRVGRNLRDALGRPAVKVTKVDGATRLITLQNPVPADWKAFATFYYNRIVDDTYLLTNVTPGPVGIGQYTVMSTVQNASLYQVRFGTKTGLSQIVQWPRGVEQIPDAFHTGDGTPVAETVTVTFAATAAKNAVYTIKGEEQYAFYTASNSWVTSLNGTPYTTTLSAAAPAVLVGGHVTPIQSGPDTGKITITASVNDEFNVIVDGTTVPVTLTAGNRTPAQIVTDIDTAVGSAVTGYVIIGGGAGDVLFYITSPTTPGALPGGLDDVSSITIAQGTAEATLGFTAFQTASGTTGAVCKAATLLSSLAGPFAITTGLNDTFKVRVNGTDYTATLPAGPAVTTGAIAVAINAVPGLSGVSSAGTGVNLDKLRLLSPTNDAQSQLMILDGNANATLGFTQNQAASQQLVTAQEVVNELMSTAGFTTAGIAYPASIEGQRYITFESLTTGLTTSTVAFSNSANSAFNASTGVNITPGTDGDSGEDAGQGFNVTSNNPAGSAGSGTPGQTYTDARTGLRFSVLPATVGSYTNTGSFTLTVAPVFQVDPSRPFYAIPGLETTVANTVGVGVGDTATVQTFNPSGQEPANGSSYYISYRYLKQDYSTRIFRQVKTIEANFGAVSAENRATLGGSLAIQNSALLVAIKQVLKVPNTNQASDQTFLAAIDELATPLPGNIRPDVMVPLATSTTVYSYLTQHVEVQSDIRQQSERLGFLGFASGTTPTTAQTIARALQSARIVMLYPDSAVITLTDQLGRDTEEIIDGTFFAAALSGAVVSPAVDVATPYDRRRLQGITRIVTLLDPITANQTATAGITVLEDLDPIIRVRHGLTTNMANILTRTPTVIQIADFVQQQSRNLLDTFVGSKFLASRTNEVNVSMTSLFRSLVQAEIVAAFTGISSTVDPDDPTILRFEAYYQPIFPLLYLVLTFNLRSRL